MLGDGLNEALGTVEFDVDVEITEEEKELNRRQREIWQERQEGHKRISKSVRREEALFKIQVALIGSGVNPEDSYEIAVGLFEDYQKRLAAIMEG